MGTSTSLSIKSHRTKSLSKRTKTNLSSKEASDFLLKKLKEQVTSPLNIAYFTMGIISNWFPGVDKLHKEVKKIDKFFDPCIDFIKEAWSMLKGKSVQKDKSKKSDHDKEQKEVQEEKKKQKREIRQI